jgi:predicted dehydrogenase
MIDEPIRVAAVGAGRVFERLYTPALALVPGLRLAAIADPDPAARGKAPQGAWAFERLEDLLDAGLCAGVMVLAPAPLHAHLARTVLSRGLPVLLEKPSVLTESDFAGWPESWHALVTPARPRRYWREYLAVRRDHSAAPSFQFVLRTSPAAWGAGRLDPPVDDLLPHVIDLAEWLSRSPVAGVSGACGPTDGAGEFVLKDGRMVRWEIGHGDAYEERVTAGHTAIDLARPAFRARLGRRLSRRPERDVEGVARMLGLWARRLRQEPAPGLPTFETALGEVRLRDALARAGAKPGQPGSNRQP